MAFADLVEFVIVKKDTAFRQEVSSALQNPASRSLLSDTSILTLLDLPLSVRSVDYVRSYYLGN